ncbi:hypothetical protein HanRHA438_Chr10g0452891 [Helianthus annuus]|nr:hypothetical protein HanIR_Chr10g0475141 [Helianthus annuus]KAJ0879556.1 hypothetical protein HanRHA438_Chr10g0452891 [Helianthus annuus]
MLRQDSFHERPLMIRDLFRRRIVFHMLEFFVGRRWPVGDTAAVVSGRERRRVKKMRASAGV